MDFPATFVSLTSLTVVPHISDPLVGIGTGIVIGGLIGGPIGAIIGGVLGGLLGGLLGPDVGFSEYDPFIRFVDYDPKEWPALLF